LFAMKRHALLVLLRAVLAAGVLYTALGRE
jgi:hypothetical protein